jgi:hypothetical protein
LKKSGEMESAQGKKRGSKAQLEALASELTDAKSSRESAEKLAAQLHTKIRELSDRATALERQALDRTQEAEHAKARSASLEAISRDLVQVRAARESAEKEAASLQARVQDLSARLDESARQALKAHQEADLAAQAKGAELANVTRELGLERSARTAAEAGAKTAQGHLEALSPELVQVKAAREAAEKQAASIQSRIQELTARLDESARQALKARQEADLAAQAKGAELTNVTRELGLERSARTAAEAGAKAAQGRLEALSPELVQVKAAREAAEKLAASLQSRVQELTARLDASGREAGKARQEAEEAKAKGAQLGAMALELTKIRTARDEAEKQATLLQSKVQEFALRGGELGQELKKAREEAEETKLRIAGLERRIVELSSEAACTASLEREALDLGRQLEESRRQMDAATEESVHRIELLERELAGLKDAEAKARGQAAEAASLRAAQAARSAEIQRLEETRKAQDARVEELRRTVADLEQQLKEAPHPPVTEEPPPAAPPEPIVTAPAEPPPPPSVPAAEPPPSPPPLLVATPAPAGSTAVRIRKLNPAEAAQDPRNLFGPAGEDGRPAYVLLEQVSVDALGVVYRACERAIDRRFAVRFMSGQAGEEQTAAIEQEVQLLIALPHPNILQVQGSGRRQNRLYIAMDLVEAPSLGRAKIQEIPRICAILRDAAEAVHYAHEESILHGDLNPENILVGHEEDRDHAYVKDFGLGHLLEGMSPQAPAKQPGLVIRDPACLAPEQMKEMKGKLSVSADVYGLGATLYTAIAGRPPFEGPDARHVLTRAMIEEPIPVERVRRDVPEALGAIIRRAMAKERSHRFASAGEMAQALTRFLEGHGTASRPKPALPEGA